MVVENSRSVSYVNYQNKVVYDDGWRHGDEVWCNLEGQFLSLVSDYSSLKEYDSYGHAMCALGVFGTVYVREKYLDTRIQLKSGQTKTITVDKIRSQYEIGNELDIKLRTLENLGWVKAEENRVTFTPTAANMGLTVVSLQSYDNNSSVKSTLKTDILYLVVDPPTQLSIAIDKNQDQELKATSYRPTVDWFTKQ